MVFRTHDTAVGRAYPLSCRALLLHVQPMTSGGLQSVQLVLPFRVSHIYNFVQVSMTLSSAN